MRRARSIVAMLLRKSTLTYANMYARLFPTARFKSLPSCPLFLQHVNNSSCNNRYTRPDISQRLSSQFFAHESTVDRQEPKTIVPNKETWRDVWDPKRVLLWRQLTEKTRLLSTESEERNSFCFDLHLSSTTVSLASIDRLDIIVSMKMYKTLCIKATATCGLCTKRWRWRKVHCAPEQPPAGARGQHEIENPKIVSSRHSNSPEYCCTYTTQLIPVRTLIFSLSHLQTGPHSSLSLPS